MSRVGDRTEGESRLWIVDSKRWIEVPSATVSDRRESAVRASPDARLRLVYYAGRTSVRLSVLECRLTVRTADSRWSLAVAPSFP